MAKNWLVFVIVLGGLPLASNQAVSAEPAITATGEIRTVDLANESRSWGKGRPGATMYLTAGNNGPSLCRNGDIGFGRSNAAVGWGSAAEACPSGSWVCTRAERGSDACDTFRPDNQSSMTCTGVYSSSHLGWLADAVSETFIGMGVAMGEDGAEYEVPTCSAISVWCCSDWY